MEIPKDVARADIPGNIPPIVAELPEGIEEPEIRPYVISFANYNDKVCEINLLNSNKARKAVEVFKKVGTKVCCTADFQKNAIDRLPVIKSGEYKKLFNKLGGDIELKEIKLQEDARIFYFDLEPEKTFYVVAITQNHFETDKVRR